MTDREMALFSVGKTMPHWQGPREEGSQFQIDRGGALLLIFLHGPTAREIRGVRSGKIRFALVPAGEHTFFLLYQIGDLTQGWSDAPFALGLVAPDRRELPPRSANRGWLIWSSLVDADTGTVLSIRGTTVTPQFSAMLDDLIDAQRAALPRFTLSAHDAAIAAAYKRWPKGKDMISAATAIEHGGMPFRAP